MLGNLRRNVELEAPYIKVNVEVASPGTTNGVPNIKKKEQTTSFPRVPKEKPSSFHFVITSSSTAALVAEVEWSSTTAPG